MDHGSRESGRGVIEPFDERRAIMPGEDFVEFKELEIEQTASDRFEAQVRLYPDRIAVKTPQKAVTYSELNEAANRFVQFGIGA